MFGGEGDDEYRCSGMMWDDNQWIFSDEREKQTWMVGDVIEELMDLDMEPKQESLWWTSTYKSEDERTVTVGRTGKSWDMPFVKIFDLLGCRFRRSGKGMQETDK